MKEVLYSSVHKKRSIHLFLLLYGVKMYLQDQKYAWNNITFNKIHKAYNCLSCISEIYDNYKAWFQN